MQFNVTRHKNIIPGTNDFTDICVQHTKYGLDSYLGYYVATHLAI